MNPTTRIRSLRTSVFAVAAVVLLAALATTASARQQRRIDRQLGIAAALLACGSGGRERGEQYHGRDGEDGCAQGTNAGSRVHAEAAWLGEELAELIPGVL